MAIQAQFPSCGAVDWVDIGCGGGGGGGGGGNNGFYNHWFTLQQQKEYLLLLQQQQQQQQQQQLLQNPQQLCSSSSSFSSAAKCNYTNVANPNSPQSMVAAFEEKQRREIDQYLKIQNERLRLLLQEQRKQQLSMVWKAVEAKALPALRQRDEEIAQAREKTRELEDFLNKLEAENREWQRVAHENEAMVVSLSNTIERLRTEKGAAGCGSGDDAESCCNNGEEEERAGEGALMEEGSHEMTCRACMCRKARVLFLPCRHLSSCDTCEEVLGACPVCLTPKKATILALMG